MNPEATTIRDQVVRAMQDAWDDYIADAHCFPDCFEWRGGNGTLWANFNRGNFAQMVADRLPTTEPLTVAMRVPGSDKENDG